jgi:hypothetical protein
MMLNVRSRSDIAVLSTLITGISVMVPLVVVSIVLWNMPLHIKLPILTIAGLIPLGIALPVSLIALSIIRQIFLKLDGGNATSAA